MEQEHQRMETRFENSIDPCAKAPYRYYREYISMPSLPLVPGTAMLSAQEWLNMPLSKCFDDFQNSEKKYQDMIMRSVSCRLMAAVKLINGIALWLWVATPADGERWAHLAEVVEVSPDDILENPLTHESDDEPESYYFLSEQKLPLHKLIIKALILQELQRRLERTITSIPAEGVPAVDQKPKERTGMRGRLCKFIDEMPPKRRIAFLSTNSGCKEHDILFETVLFPRYNTLYPKDAMKDIKGFKQAVSKAKQIYKSDHPDWMVSE
ncbi:MAG: hypothetical protein LAC69_04375 [Chlorobium sp.]|nr:hypothetical protein [Chlorobium sp.]